MIYIILLVIYAILLLIAMRKLLINVHERKRYKIRKRFRQLPMEINIQDITFGQIEECIDD